MSHKQSGKNRARGAQACNEVIFERADCTLGRIAPARAGGRLLELDCFVMEEFSRSARAFIIKRDEGAGSASATKTPQGDFVCLCNSRSLAAAGRRRQNHIAVVVTRNQCTIVSTAWRDREFASLTCIAPARGCRGESDSDETTGARRGLLRWKNVNCVGQRNVGRFQAGRAKVLRAWPVWPLAAAIDRGGWRRKV